MKPKARVHADWPEGLPRSWARGPFLDANQALTVAEGLYAAQGMEVERGTEATPLPDGDEVELIEIGSQWWLHQRPRAWFRAPPGPGGVSLACVDERVSKWTSVEGQVLLAAADPDDPAGSFARAMKSTLGARVALVLRPRRWTHDAALDELAQRITKSVHRRVVLPRPAGVFVGIDGAEHLIESPRWSRLLEAGFAPGPTRLPANTTHAWAFVRVERPDEVALDAVTLSLYSVPSGGGSGADRPGSGTLASLPTIGEEYVVSSALLDLTGERTFGLSASVTEGGAGGEELVAEGTSDTIGYRVVHRVEPLHRWKVDVQTNSHAVQGGVLIEALARVVPTTQADQRRHDEHQAASAAWAAGLAQHAKDGAAKSAAKRRRKPPK